MLGQMVSHLEMVEDIRREVAYNGGIGYSEHYAEYLIEETPDAIYVEKTQENIIRQKDLPKPLVFPNPAVERITMKYSLAKTTSLDIRLLSMTGELVRNLNSGEVEAGEHELAIDLIDLKSGVYLVTIHSEELQQTVRFVKR